MWGYMYLLKLLFLFYSEKYPRVKLLYVMVFYNLCEYDNHMRKLPLVYHEQAMETGNSSNFFF